MASVKNPRLLITLFAAVVVAGGLVRLAVDDEAVAFSVPEPQPPAAGIEAEAAPTEIATSLGVALSASEHR